MYEFKELLNVQPKQITKLKVINGNKIYEKVDCLKVENMTFTDSGLSRILSHINNKQVMVLSAFRSNLSKEENLSRHEQIKQDIRAKGLGYVESLGAYREEGHDYSYELSLIVPYKDTLTKQEFVEFGIELCNKYNQDSILVVIDEINNGKPTYLTKSADVDMDFDKTHIYTGKEDYFTQLAKGDKRGFVFGDSVEFDKLDERYIGKRIPTSQYEAVKMSKNGGLF